MREEELRQIQTERLFAVLNRVYKEVPFYRILFDKHSLNPEEFEKPEDLRSYPFTTRDDLRKNYPYNMFAVPLREVVRILPSAGTTGAPIVVGYTRNDIYTLAELNARTLRNLDITKEDFVMITFHRGLFASAFGIQSGAELIGASVIPTNLEDPVKTLRILLDYRVTTLICSPSFAIWLAETLLNSEFNPNTFMLRRVILCGEPFSEAQREFIENTLKVKAYNVYAVTEVFGPSVASECKARQGLHFQEDHFYVEILNPDTLRPVKPGEIGEIVVTTLTKEALPLIRYRTGDLTSILPQPCPCGSPFLQTERILGRLDDLVLFRGVKFHPGQVELLIEQITKAKVLWQVLLWREEGVEKILLQIAASESIFSDSFSEQERIRKEIEEKLFLEFGIPIPVKFVEASSLVKEGEAFKKIVDKR